jgi:hypothetical protein
MPGSQHRRESRTTAHVFEEGTQGAPAGRGGSHSAAAAAAGGAPRNRRSLAPRAAPQRPLGRRRPGRRLRRGQREEGLVEARHRARLEHERLAVLPLLCLLALAFELGLAAALLLAAARLGAARGGQRSWTVPVLVMAQREPGTARSHAARKRGPRGPQPQPTSCAAIFSATAASKPPRSAARASVASSRSSGTVSGASLSCGVKGLPAHTGRAWRA